jgi:hypothetical protein
MMADPSTRGKRLVLIEILTHTAMGDEADYDAACGMEDAIAAYDPFQLDCVTLWED